uniref:DUF1758 domain-containing protein n=1 Tax=Glossina brevipalpis TaxID=37001 RepID=A0A1A9WWS0_9MUSC
MDLIMGFTLQQKLENESNAEWQKYIGAPTEIPIFGKFKQFLHERFTVLEALSTAFKKPLKADLNKRRKMTRSAHLCYNCLSGKHIVIKCAYNSLCRKFQGKHHIVLHFTLVNNEQSEETTARVISYNAYSTSKQGAVLLATAQIWVKGFNGSFITLRALLDQGSQGSFISERAAQLLKLPRKRSHLIINGIEVPSISKETISAIVKEKWSEKTINIQLFILLHIGSETPQGKWVNTIRKMILTDSNSTFLVEWMCYYEPTYMVIAGAVDRPHRINPGPEN